jgi:hypothetical protein
MKRLILSDDSILLWQREAVSQILQWPGDEKAQIKNGKHDKKRRLKPLFYHREHSFLFQIIGRILRHISGDAGCSSF